MNKFYSFIQNNSFGYYIGPVAIIVRAADSVEANQKAESKGVYFDGKNDCPCCGNR